MNTKIMLLDYIDAGNKEGIKRLYVEEKISIEEYRHSCELMEEKVEVSYELSPHEYANQFTRAKRYYNALRIFCLIDIIPFVWMLLFFIYIPVVIYTWVVAFGKPIILPNETAVSENNQLGKFIVMSWIPGIGIIADIAILAKVSHISRLIKEDVSRYTIAYYQNQQQVTGGEQL